MPLRDAVRVQTKVCPGVAADHHGRALELADKGLPGSPGRPLQPEWPACATFFEEKPSVVTHGVLVFSRMPPARIV
jgi:hypothetical protein